MRGPLSKVGRCHGDPRRDETSTISEVLMCGRAGATQRAPTLGSLAPRAFACTRDWVLGPMPSRTRLAAARAGFRVCESASCWWCQPF